MRRTKKLLSTLLVFVLLFSGLFADFVKAADVNINVTALYDQDIIVLGSPTNPYLIDGHMMFKYKDGDTNFSIRDEARMVDPDWINAYMNGHDSLYCLQKSMATPTDNTVEYENADTLESTDYYTEKTLDKLRVVLKYGYPANKDYWYDQGVTNYAVQREVTQLAIWYITSNRNGWDGIPVHTDTYNFSFKAVDDNLVEYASATADGSTEWNAYYVNSAYDPNGAGQSMLQQMLHMVKYNETGITGADAQCKVSALTDRAVYDAQTKDFIYYYKVEGINMDTDNTAGLRITSVAGLPDDGRVYVADWNDNYTGITNWTQIPVSSSGPTTLATGVKETTKVVMIRTAKLGANITLECEVPRRAGLKSYYFAPIDPLMQRFIQTAVVYEGDNNAVKILAADAPAVFVNIVKYDADTDEALGQVKFRLIAPDRSEEVKITENDTGYVGFFGTWNETYYLEETDNGVYQDGYLKLNINGTEVISSLGERIAVYFDYGKQCITVSGVDIPLVTNPNGLCNDVGTLKVYNRKPKLELTITKVDADENNAPIQDVEFTIYSDSTEDSYNTNANGVLDFEIEWDKQYYIAETENGKHNRKVVFNVGDSVVETTLGTKIPIKADFATQTIKIGNNTYGLNKIDDSKYVFTDITVENSATAIILVDKVDAAGNTTKIPGVTFGIYYDEACRNPVKLDGTAITGKTDSNGQLKFDNLKVNTLYYIKELATVEPYLLSDEVYKIDTSKAKATGYDYQIHAYTYAATIENTKQTGSITVVKEGNVLVDYTANGFVWENRRVPNITFGIYSDIACTSLIAQVTTGSDGTVTKDNLDIGKTYYVKELLTDEATSLLVSTEVKPVTVAYNAVGNVVVNETVQFDDVPQKVEIEITKTDSNGAALSGAEFTLKNKEAIKNYLGNVIVPEGTVLDVKTTGADGQLLFDSLPNGTYTVTETKVPQGYIDEKKSVDVIATFDPDKGETLTKNERFVNNKQSGIVQVYKKGNVLVDVRDGKFIYEDRYVSGVVFDVLDSGKRVVDTITTNENGYAASKTLPLGTYYVVEKKSYAGGVIDTTEHKVELNYDSTPLVSTVYGTLNLTNKRQKVNLSIFKVDADNEQVLLDGAVFELYSKDDIYDYTHTKLLIKAGQLIESAETLNGTLTFKSDLSHGIYTATEVKAPQGYALADKDKVTVTFDATYKSDAVEYIALNEIIKNQKTKILVAKHDAVGLLQDQLAGAKLHIEDLNGNIVYKFTTSDTPEAIEGLPVGKYLLVEDEAPWGFEIADPVEIEILNIAELQKFDMIDQPLFGEVEFSYDNSGDWFRMPNVAADVPSTGDASDMIQYVLVMLGALVTLLLATKKKSWLRYIGGAVLVFSLMFPITAYAEETTTETHSYTTTDKDQKYDFEDTKEVDGITYELTNVTYDIKENEIIKEVAKTHTVESNALYLGESENGMFENSVTVDGETYTLKDIRKIPMNSITNRSENHVEAVQYVGYVDLIDVQPTMTVNVYDPLLKRAKTTTLKYKSTEITNSHWSDDFGFVIRVNVIGPYYKVNGNVVEYNAEAPQLEKYGEYFLSSMNLDNTKYKINSMAWDGDLYEENGTTYRNIAVSGSRLLNDYTVTYEGPVVLDDITNVYKYEATYSCNLTEKTGEYEYDIVATATYTEKAAPVSDIGSVDQDNKSDNSFVKTLIIGLTAVIVVALIFILIFFLVRRKRTQKAITYSKDDDRSTF